MTTLVEFGNSKVIFMCRKAARRYNDAGLRAATEATTLQLRVIDGDLKYYNENVCLQQVSEAECDLQCRCSESDHFYRRGPKEDLNDHGQDTHYFNYGAYAALTSSSNYMESSWKGIQVFNK